MLQEVYHSLLKQIWNLPCSDTFRLRQVLGSPRLLQGSSQDYEDRFLITDLEVWGVGSSKELEEQKKQWDWEKKQAEARQSVNLRSMGEDRALLEMVGLVGNHGSGGSV